MAHIRKSYNDLEEKLREEKQAYYNRVQAQCPVFHVNQAEKMLRYLQSGLNQLSGREFDQSVKLLEQLMK